MRELGEARPERSAPTRYGVGTPDLLDVENGHEGIERGLAADPPVAHDSRPSKAANSPDEPIEHGVIAPADREGAA